MGYSIGMRPRSKALKDKMKQFMEKHYRLPHIVFKKFYDIDVDYSRFTDDMSYDHGKWALGFDYNACEPERDYIFAVCRWMALKIGKTRKYKDIGGEAPFYVYDGGASNDDRFPVLVRSEWPKVPVRFLWALTDSVGHRTPEQKFVGVPKFMNEDRTPNMVEIRKHIKSSSDLMDMDLREVYAVIKKELNRLDQLWRKCSA